MATPRTLREVDEGHIIAYMQYLDRPRYATNDYFDSDRHTQLVDKYFDTLAKDTPGRDEEGRKQLLDFSYWMNERLYAGDGDEDGDFWYFTHDDYPYLYDEGNNQIASSLDNAASDFLQHYKAGDWE